MSSLLRAIQRKHLRKHDKYEARPQVIQYPDGGYRTLRPTGGWVFVSYRRLAAQEFMRKQLVHDLPVRAKRAPKVWRVPAEVPELSATFGARQRRRAEQRAAA